MNGTWRAICARRATENGFASERRAKTRSHLVEAAPSAADRRHGGRKERDYGTLKE